MTLFKFLSAAAWTGIVSPNLAGIAFHLACGSVAAIVLLAGQYRFLPSPLPFDLFGLLILFNWLEKEKESECVFLDPAHEIFE